MGLSKEYRICMPLTVEEYKIAQLYMVARHSFEQSHGGEGVEVVENCEYEDSEHGKGQFTEKRVHLSSRLPTWVQALIPKVFYITEKAWNYYPYTITKYTCSFLPLFEVNIETRYEDNNGSNDNVFQLEGAEFKDRQVDVIDIAYDELDAKYFKETEDPKFFKSKLTSRGPLVEGWIDTFQPIMCSYKWVTASFSLWGLQTKVEEFIHSCIRHTLLIGHRQAFVWIDEWFKMTLEDVREYEKKMQETTNLLFAETNESSNESSELIVDSGSTSSQPSTPNTPRTPLLSPSQPAKKSWLPW